MTSLLITINGVYPCREVTIRAELHPADVATIHAAVAGTDRGRVFMVPGRRADLEFAHLQAPAPWFFRVGDVIRIAEETPR